MQKDEKVEMSEAPAEQHEQELSTNGKAEAAVQAKETKEPSEVAETESKQDKQESQSGTVRRSRARKRDREIAALKTENAQLKDQLLRKAAEFDNFRKRKERELLESFSMAKAELIKKILPALDDLDRALQAAGEKKDIYALIQGIELVSKAFHKILEDENVQMIEAVGKEFDPEIHEAMMQMEKEGVEPNIVLEEMQKGYRHGDRVLRPARVIVSK